FRLIWFNWDVFSDRPLSLTEGIALEVAIEQIKLFLYQQIHEEFGKPDLPAEDREVLGGLTPFQVDAMADELYSRDDLLGRYIRWALLSPAIPPGWWRGLITSRQDTDGISDGADDPPCC